MQDAVAANRGVPSIAAAKTSFDKRHLVCLHCTPLADKNPIRAAPEHDGTLKLGAPPAFDKTSLAHIKSSFTSFSV